MNPLLNAYNYQIKKLTEEINFLRNQNISLLSYLNENFDYPDGYEIAQGPSGTQLPPGVNPLEIPGQQNNPFTFPGSERFNRQGFRTRGRFLDSVWRRYTNSQGQVLNMEDIRRLFGQLNDILNGMTQEQWNMIVDYMRNNNITLDQLDLNGLLRLFNSAPLLRIYRPGAVRRFGREIKKAYSNLPGWFRWSAIIIALLSAGYLAFGFESEEAFERAIQEWLDSGSQEPPPWAENWGDQNGVWDDLPDPDPNFGPQSDDTTPSMLPPSNPTSTTAPSTGRGWGGVGSNQIDQTQMGM